MPELEEILMRQCKIPYKTARELVLESRSTLGLSKYDEWTPDLQAAAERLYTVRYGGKLSDCDSTRTPITVRSYDSDQQPPSVVEGKSNFVERLDATEEPSETDGALHETAEEVSSKKKKKKKSLLNRLGLKKRA